jgi:HK97 family phage major capsid protein
LKKTLDDKKREIEELEAELAEKDAMVKSLEDTLKEKDEEVDQLEQILKDKDDMIAELERQLEELEKAKQKPEPKPKAEPKPKPAVDANYRAKKGDMVDELLAKYLEGINCRVPFKRLGDGYYLFGTRKIYCKILNGKLVVRVGGGYMIIEEFIQTYSD